MSAPSAELLLVLGPGLLFAMALAETSMPLGLLVPAGVATALGAFLATEGFIGLPQVLIAAGAGAVTGDSIGYWLGRTGSARLLRVPGPVGRLARRFEQPAARLFAGRPIVAISLARTVSFVRTLMPASAGMSGISYPRFLLFGIPGVLAWLLLYGGIGVVAGESWRLASGILGTGWAALIVLVGGVSWLVARARRLRNPT